MRIDTSQIQELSIEILKYFPNRPFLCLPMSALLYANLKDNFNSDAHLVTGNFLYKDQYVFKQDFSIEENISSSLLDWSGHAWVEYENWIIDLSFFRTLYSDQFTKAYKNELIKLFGTGRGLLISEIESLKEKEISYQAIDRLKDNTATSIIHGIEKLPIWS